LPDFYNVTVRIADVAARLATLVLRLGEVWIILSKPASGKNPSVQFSADAI
jgi:hypothetical protein